MANLLFISLSGRVIRDTEGKLYLNSHMNSNIISRYQRVSDNLTLLLRDNCQTVGVDKATKCYNPIPNGVMVIPCENPYKPITNVINPIARRKIKQTIKNSIIQADKIIIGQATGIYANIAIEMCRKYKKKHLVIVGGFSFECDWYNSVKGKIVAHYREYMCKRNILNADYVLYVTDWALQNRYPTKGKSLGCSDVEIYTLDKDKIEIRKERYMRNKGITTIGTMAQLDVRLKGVRYVIEAIAYLKSKGYRNFKYQIVGNGDDTELKELVKKLDIEDEVLIMGSIPHEMIYNWVDTIDLYIQPSFTEGLSRSILEAMSRACPVICSNAGGNVELGHVDYQFNPGSSEEIANMLLKVNNVESLALLSEYSIKKASNYTAKELDGKRNTFLREFMNS